MNEYSDRIKPIEPIYRSNNLDLNKYSNRVYTPSKKKEQTNPSLFEELLRKELDKLNNSK